MRVLGREHPNTFTTRHNLAHLQSPDEEAMNQLKELLADQIRVLGPDHPDTLSTRNGVALQLYNAGRLEEASNRFQRACWPTSCVSSAPITPTHS